jgi:benzoyl-CoA reductase subunit A
MKYYLGIDLGSTTTKALLIDENEEIIGRGLTNTRCNYFVATEVAKSEALNSARFFLLKRELEKSLIDDSLKERLFDELGANFRVEQQLSHLDLLNETCEKTAPKNVKDGVSSIFKQLKTDAQEIFADVKTDQSRFFRDMAGSAYCAAATKVSESGKVSFDSLVAVYDKAILQVENQVPEIDFQQMARKAQAAMKKQNSQKTEMHEAVDKAISSAAVQDLKIEQMVGTGYGRQRLPFEKNQIRSEILCHGLGAHFMFPNTRTVLDIGGQDTKAIQIDDKGVVTNFQMNDRCAAGCGRYLGYIADELNVGLHELGPLSLAADRACQICSTCTVFAGAELRDLLSLGESRENILSGLHQAIVLRAMSLLARSGGVENEFTFTGGVAKNGAVVKALDELVAENYGERKLNIHTDSIFTGALGAALYAHRAIDLEGAEVA